MNHVAPKVRRHYHDDLIVISNIVALDDVYGPFIELPPELQKRALEFMYYIDTDAEKVLISISKCKSRK